MTRPKDIAIGVDLGATTVKAGVVSREGKILDQRVSGTMAQRGPDAVLDQIALTVNLLLEEYPAADCLGIGIGTPGVVTAGKGIVRDPPNFVNWTEVDLRAAIESRISLPAVVANDANAAAMAEAVYGAGKAFKDFLFVIWGTGVGGGIILDKKIYAGPYGGAGEIGHVSIDASGPQCNCGSRGCIEAYIGQRYLSRRTQEILEKLPADGPGSRISELVDGNLNLIEPVLIARAAEAGDRTASDILLEAGRLLGYALASVLNVLDLEIVVIGGGISASPQFVFDAIDGGVRSRVLKPHKSGIRVLRASLGNAAGIIGAASLVFDR